MAAPKLWPTSVLPQPGTVGPWIDWGQARTISAGRTSKAFDFGRALWRYRVVLSRRTEEDAIAVETLLNSLDGWMEPFRIPISRDRLARPGSGTITITTPGTIGNSLPTQGWSPSNGLVLPKGAFICVTHVDDEPRLFQVSTNITASGGAATISVDPPMQIPSGTDEQIHYGAYNSGDPALMTVVLSNPDEARRQMNHPVWSDFVIDLEEWWEDRPTP